MYFPYLAGIVPVMPAAEHRIALAVVGTGVGRLVGGAVTFISSGFGSGVGDWERMITNSSVGEVVGGAVVGGVMGGGSPELPFLSSVGDVERAWVAGYGTG